MSTNFSVISFLYQIVFFLIPSLYVAQISVLSPQDLSNKFTKDIEVSYSLYGQVPYGSTTFTKLKNPSIKSFSKSPFLACKPIEDYISKEAKEEQNFISTALIADRGHCSFVTKSRMIQKTGGEIAIIINDRDFDSFLEEVFLADDGTGSDIVIPTVFISHKDGQVIKDYLLEHPTEEVILAVNFNLKHSAQVKYDLFFSSDNLNMYSFLVDYETYIPLFKENTVFNIHYVSYISDDYQKGVAKELPFCIASGKFCAIPRYDLGIEDGRLIVQENIRQKCVFITAFKKDNEGRDYFRYMREFNSQCISTKQFTEDCAKKVISEEISHLEDQVNECIANSYYSPLDGKNHNIEGNQLLDKDYEIQKKLNVQVLPGIVVNDREIFGSITAYNLFEAICGGFNILPTYCHKNSEYKTAAEPKQESSDLSTGSIVLIILIVIVVNVAIVYVCKKYIVKKMHEKIESSEINGKINNVVTAYLALRDK